MAGVRVKGAGNRQTTGTQPADEWEITSSSKGLNATRWRQVTGRPVADSVKAVLKGVLNTWTEGRLEDTQVDLSKWQVQRETTERGRDALSRSIDLAQYKDDGSIGPHTLKQNRTH